LTIAGVATQPATSRARRLAEAIAFVGLWIALGYALRLDGNAYLILGIPLTVVFQVLVRRGRLEDLWVQGGRPFGRSFVPALTAGAALAAALLFVTPVGSLGPGLWAAIVGAFGAVYALRQANAGTARDALGCVAIVAVIGIAIEASSAIGRGLSDRSPAERLAVGALYLPLQFAIMFLLEEVSFRGAIDSHVHRGGESMGLFSAGAVSGMWGLWHLPLVAELSVVVALLGGGGPRGGRHRALALLATLGQPRRTRARARVPRRVAERPGRVGASCASPASSRSTAP
jgi:hypothetical protein